MLVHRRSRGDTHDASEYDRGRLSFWHLPAMLLESSPRNVDWPRVGNDPGCMRYSQLDQINRQNVTRLKPAWTYHTRELEGRTGKTIECTPIVIDGVMYVTTGYLRVVALDAATGKELWQFDPLKDHPFAHRPASGGVNRGCAYWSDGKPDGERRIIHGTSDGRLFSLDAKTGKLDPKFGDGGIRNLRKELDPKVAGAQLWADVGPGHLERYDHRRGLLRRRARHRRAGGHPRVRRPHRRARSGGSGPSPVRASSATRPGKAIPGRTAAAPTPGAGSASTRIAAWSSPDSDRRPSTSTAATGTAITCSRTARSRSTRGRASASGTFRRLHHDLWDHDLPVYPNLVTVTHDGKPIDAVAQVTKTGYVFLFDRETGKPLFDVEERPRARLRRPRRTGLADAADPGQAAAVLRPVSR